MGRTPNVGDVFIIPTGDDRAGVGQVVGTYGEAAYYFAIFDLVLPLDQAASHAAKALSAPVLFLALSMDAKLHVGHWSVVAKAPVDPNLPLPAYKEVVGSPGRIDVVDYSGTRRRRATPAEAATLRNRAIVAPVRVERALRAFLGLEPWLEAFEELKVETLTPSADMFD